MQGQRQGVVGVQRQGTLHKIAVEIFQRQRGFLDQGVKGLKPLRMQEVGDVVGAHMIGAEVTELLGELSMAKLLESTTRELGWLVHPHPTISEMVKEAALAADGEAIHI